MIAVPAKASSSSPAWRRVKLREICSKPQYGWTTKARQDGTGLKLLRTTDITSGQVEWRTVPFCTELPPDVEKYLVHDGDILISRAGSVGVSHLVKSTQPAVFASYLIRFKPGPDVLPKYLAYFLQSPGYWKQIADNTAGIAVPNVNASKLQELDIPLAPLDEQERIVAELERQFSRLDEAVANLKRAKASISRFRASVLAEAAHSAGCAWPSRTIGSLLREPIVNGLSVKESQRSTEVRALRLSAMSDAGLDYEDHRFLPIQPTAVEDILVTEGDFFVSRGNGSLALVGRGATAQVPPFPIIFPDTMMRLRFADIDVRRWVATLWPSRLVRRQIEQRVKTTAGIYKIAQPQVASICVPLPPALERQRIVADVDRRLSVVREVEAEVDVNLAKAGALRWASLALAFSVQEGGPQ